MASSDTVARAAVERNLSELAATVNLLFARLRAADIIEG